MPHPHRPNAGKRKLNHDYRSRCIYHIVLNKAGGIPDFSEVIGEVDNHQWPPAVRLQSTGNVAAKALSSLKAKYPFTSILRRCIMPDHIHFVIFVKDATETHLGQIITEFKTTCSKLWKELGNSPDISLFSPGYYDTILKSKGQLQRMLAYVSDNPRRYLVRKQFPGWFRRFSITDGQRCYEAYGNWDLLDDPQIVPVRISRSFSTQELLEYKRQWHQAALNDGVLVSPFIHPGEKSVRDWAAENGAALIILTHQPFTDRYKPEGRLFDMCAEGRLLVVSVPPEGTAGDKPSRAHCLHMNAVAAEIAAGNYRGLLR